MSKICQRITVPICEANFQLLHKSVIITPPYQGEGETKGQKKQHPEMAQVREDNQEQDYKQAGRGEKGDEGEQE